MRRWVALATAVLSGLGAWIAVGALTVTPRPAAAQTPAVEIHKVQQADFVPARTGNRPIVILALGSDARPGEEVDRRLADSIHLIAVNAKEGGATILGFPRDSYVPIPGVGTRKINDALFYGGPELVVQTVQDLTGIPIDYYMLTSFRGLKQMVDEIGGIEVDIPYAMSDPASGAFFEPGLQRLNGEQALALARNRKSTPNGDFSRSENQGLLLLAALRALHEDFTENPASIFTWVAVGARHILTDLPLEELLELTLTALHVDPEKVTNMVLPGGIGSAGGASVVILADSSALYADIRDDGLIGSG